MGRFFLGVFTTILLVASLCGVLFALDQSGLLSLQPSVIGILGNIPGWQDLPKALADGRKESKSWMQKEKVYQAQATRLRQENSKLQKELDNALIKKEPSSEVKSPPIAVEVGKAKTPLQLAPSASQAAMLLADMKAPAAAGILLKVPPQVALEILQKMDNRKAAKIMEALPVENGSALLAKLAQEKLPEKTGK